MTARGPARRTRPVGGRGLIAAHWSGPRLALWGSELSPFALKLRAMLAYAELDYAWLPDDGAARDTRRSAVALELAKRRRLVERHGGLDALDEYPLVPFLFEDDGPIRYDSSALARWIDATHPPARGRLFPDAPLERFVAQLIEEGFDELGLYVVHHRRWVTAAADNDAGERLARELRTLIPPGLSRIVARRFARRQVRRLPYLFSVAPPGFALPGVPRALTPPARPGFPATHALLDELWQRLVDAVDEVLAVQPYLLGERFTVADASVYGQLGMNLIDASAAARMRERVPRTYAWLRAIAAGAHTRARGELRYDPVCARLVDVLRDAFVPLMRQNAAAYERASAAGVTLFDERAFDRGVALYDGELCGHPFRSVVKRFQLRPWRELQAAHAALTPSERRIVPLDPPAAR